MKILIVNAYDTVGGASRAAYRLHKSLLAEGVDSKMLVQIKKSNISTVISTSSKIREKFINPFRPALDHVLMKFCGARTLFSSSYTPFSEIVEQINQINPDIVHLHWITGGMMTIEDVAKINTPIVWSLHDMWAFTDGYHYDETYDIYKNYCDNEPKNFLSSKVFNRKQITYSKIGDMTIVGLSHWMCDCAKNSILLKDKQHINLPNPIDTNVFKPFNKSESRKLWGLPQDKKLVLFGAMRATDDPRKGFSELSKALRQITISNVELVVFGNSEEPKFPPDFGFKTHYFGKLHNDMCLAKLYSAVDVIVVPSLQENLSNTIMESLACATPVVGFDIGGNSDMIDHQQNGYLVKPFNIIDLKIGIEWVLNHNSFNDLQKNARQKVLVEFNSKVVAKKYVKLYKDILQMQ
jgi:glycosyltransferase involved in cell wall biosynthesis